eukprot:GHVR01042088.1.p1 GENE.GHVR01042088.1~~GHVR01042088.1.p1  ORF type:complete len:145 (-),score=2.90 GHVR01042088.1:39-473(-)
MLDNSAYSINGDYNPTRWLNQTDAASLLIKVKMEQDHQTAIGIGLMAGNQVEIICTPSTDIMKVSSFLYGVKQYGHIKFCNSLQIAALALKHRADVTLRQKIICFVASSINDSLEELKILSKKLKKNSVSVDIMALGDLSANQR